MRLSQIVDGGALTSGGPKKKKKKENQTYLGLSILAYSLAGDPGLLPETLQFAATHRSILAWEDQYLQPQGLLSFWELGSP